MMFTSLLIISSSAPATSAPTYAPPQANQAFMKKIPPGSEADNILVGELDFLDRAISGFVRLSQACHLGDLTEVPVPTRFLFILLGPHTIPGRYHEIGRSMATLMSDEVRSEPSEATELAQRSRCSPGSVCREMYKCTNVATLRRRQTFALRLRFERTSLCRSTRFIARSLIVASAPVLAGSLSALSFAHLARARTVLNAPLGLSRCFMMLPTKQRAARTCSPASTSFWTRSPSCRPVLGTRPFASVTSPREGVIDERLTIMSDACSRTT